MNPNYVRQTTITFLLDKIENMSFRAKFHRIPSCQTKISDSPEVLSLSKCNKNFLVSRVVNKNNHSISYYLFSFSDFHFDCKWSSLSTLLKVGF